MSEGKKNVNENFCVGDYEDLVDDNMETHNNHKTYNLIQEINNAELREAAIDLGDSYEEDEDEEVAATMKAKKNIEHDDDESENSNRTPII